MDSDLCNATADSDLRNATTDSDLCNAIAESDLCNATTEDNLISRSACAGNSLRHVSVDPPELSAALQFVCAGCNATDELPKDGTTCASISVEIDLCNRQ